MSQAKSCVQQNSLIVVFVISIPRAYLDVRLTQFPDVNISVIVAEWIHGCSADAEPRDEYEKLRQKYAVGNDCFQMSVKVKFKS